MNAAWYDTQIAYCMVHNRVVPLANCLAAAGRCVHVSDREYTDMLLRVREWWLL